MTYQKLLEDIIRLDIGKLSMTDLRDRWRKGDYQVPPAYAKWAMERK